MPESLSDAREASVIFPGEVFANPLDFDPGMRQLLPYYPEMLGAIVRCIPQDAQWVLELGCGTGELSRLILEACPTVHLIALDYSPRMLAVAQTKLKTLGFADRVTWVELDFGAWAMSAIADPTLASGLAQPVDACVSSLAIHHLEDATKQQLFRRIFEQLQPGGGFWNADPVLPETEFLAQVYRAAREDWAVEKGVVLSELRSQMGISQPQGYSGPDRLASLDWHLRTLQSAGFQSTAVPWKYYGFAVFGGVKPEGSTSASV